MRFFYNNLVDDYTLAASSEETGYPVTNIQDPQLAKVHHTTVVTSQMWIISASATVLTASTAVILGHNLTSTAWVFIQGNDTNAWGAATTSVLFSTYATIMSVAFTETTHRYWRFRIYNDNNPDTYLSIGRLGLGTYLDWSQGIGIDWPLEYVDTSEVQYSRTGQSFGNEGITYRIARLAFPKINDTQRKQLETMFEDVKTVKPIVWWPDESYNTYVEPMYCVFNENLTFNHMYAYNWNGATALREVF
jgi:hypothetical protein